VHEFVSLNSDIIPAGSALTHAVSSAALYGKGVFTTLRIYSGEKDEMWYEHWLRLGRDARRIGIDISLLDVAEIGNAIDELVLRNNVLDGRVRVTLFDESPTELWPTASTMPGTTVLITTGDLRPVPEKFNLTVSPFTISSTSPLAGVKSCNYLDKIIAKNEARNRGFDECIQINERGEIVSASMANVFWQKGNTLYTPSLATGCVPGITRLAVLEGVAGGRRMTGDTTPDCFEVEARLEELAFAEQIFLTSAGLGVVQVAEFDGRPLVRDEYHPLVWMFLRVGEHKNTRNRSE
jgi:branched-subunit amino acid aminotransferase/4-amino-4-deoxychorismate lyase